ncbi:hypothetical protein BDP27DRAFT_1293065 [Rhodocollybia butyracea]|uniref:MARVEL domain-containing protein n=1 Tax=Rhodocollybia butyracea TaxID=206335 RepID=A0A9P5PU20_9AGAR|nr:hypothetical protein BDP27DRAFT_1293065 [Rhodocollybia butyracea]
MADFPALRISLYSALAIFSIVLLGLAGARIHYTTHLSPDDPLNHGSDFYDPIVAELIATSSLAILWSWFIIHCIHKRHENRFISTFLGEFIGLFVLWLMYLVGAAIATTFWGNLAFCQVFIQCRTLTALVAFAWMNFIIMTFIFIVDIAFVVANGGLREPLHGRWDPRASHYGGTNRTSTRPNSY